MRPVLLAALAMLHATTSRAQDPMAHADSLYAAAKAAAALSAYESVLATNPSSYEALWKAARSAIDLGEFDRNIPRRDSLYVRARGYARRAVQARPDDAEGHFQLSRALGRVALAAGVRERVRLAEEVHAEALEALARNPDHDGALHILGVWNAEIRRLNAFERMMAKTFLGGRVLGQASWEAAVSYMKRAVAAAPSRIVHHLDLGRIYADLGRKDEARAEFVWIANAKPSDYNDPEYKRLAAEALRGLK